MNFHVSQLSVCIGKSNLMASKQVLEKQWGLTHAFQEFAGETTLLFQIFLLLCGLSFGLKPPLSFSASFSLHGSSPSPIIVVHQRFHVFWAAARTVVVLSDLSNCSMMLLVSWV